jgi:cell division protein ZapA
MSEVEIRIGGRPFTVACQPGEEDFLIAAAKLLDAEAQPLVSDLGKMADTQMLLMAGLMLADKAAGLEEKLKKGDKGAKAAPAEMPEGRFDRLETLALKAETLAGEIEAKAE